MPKKPVPQPDYDVNSVREWREKNRSNTPAYARACQLGYPVVSNR
jgi:hypothetical protein